MERLGVYKLSPIDNFVHMRWMIRTDLPQVLMIEKANPETNWTEKDFLDNLRNRFTIGMVAEKFGRILGYMVYELHQSIQLINIAVHPEWRRSRIGTQLMTKIKTKLESHKRRKLALEVRDTNVVAHQFFCFNELKATVVPECFEGSDGYHFIYETNGEDEYAY